jgi:hypothetical protein
MIRSMKRIGLVHFWQTALFEYEPPAIPKSGDGIFSNISKLKIRIL